MTTNILVIGDPHSKRSNQSEIVMCAQKIFQHIIQLKPNAVVILGDLGNDHEKVYVTALNGMAHFLRLINDAAIAVSAKVYYVVGNHDAENNQIFLEDNHVMNVFKEWQNLVIVDRPVKKTTKDGAISFCPYVPPGRFVEALDTIGRESWSQSSIVFCHQEFLGAKLGAIPSKVGDKWDLSWPMIISGHIHDYGKLQDNCLYVGAPMYHTFADEGQKSISLITLENGVITEQRIDLGMPIKLSIHVTTTEALAYEIPDNTNVRMYVSGTTQEFAKFKKHKRYAELMQRVKIIPQITDPVKLPKHAKRLSYIDILTQDCSKENQRVKEALDEVLK